MKKTFKLYIVFLIIGIFSINIFVQADYDKPVAPTDLKSDIIKSANTILDGVYNKRTNKTKYPTLESYIVYIDKINDKLKVLKNTFSTSDFRYVLINYLSTGLTNIKSSVQDEIVLNSITEATNDNSNTGITQPQLDSVVTLTGNQTIAGTKTFSSPIVAPTPTANNQLTTKSYVDSAVSTAGKSNGGGSCDGNTLYIKWTEKKYDGDLGGKSGANEKCNLEYPGFHLCHTKEIKKAGLEGCLPNVLQYYFILGEPPKIDDTDNNCDNWTSVEGQSATGFVAVMGHWAMQKYLQSCAYPEPLLCCSQ